MRYFNKLFFIIVCVLFFAFFSFNLAGAYLRQMFFDFDPTLVPCGTLLKDHPQVLNVGFDDPPYSHITNNQIFLDDPEWVSIMISPFSMVNEKGFIEIDIASGFASDVTITLWNDDLYLGVTSHPHPTASDKILFEFKIMEGTTLWQSRWQADGGVWSSWTTWGTHGRPTSFNNISLGIRVGTGGGVLNDIQVFDYHRPPFTLDLGVFDEIGTTIVNVPNFIFPARLITDFSVEQNDWIGRIDLVFVNTLTNEVKTLTAWLGGLFVTPPPEGYYDFNYTISDFSVGSWELVGYNVSYWDDFGFSVPLAGHIFQVKPGHWLVPPPPVGDVLPPDFIPPIHFPVLPEPEPRPVGILEGLVWDITHFFRGLFVPSAEAIGNLSASVANIQNRFPFNYIRATSNFFRGITYIPANPKIPAFVVSVPLAGQIVSFEIINFDWLPLPVDFLGTTMTISAIFQMITTFFLVFLIIIFIISIIKVIL